MIIDCISDLHGHYPELEGGDLLIVAGDLTARDEEKEYLKFDVWLTQQSYKKKIIIAGNHDNFIEQQEDRFRRVIEMCHESTSVSYLCDS